MINIRISFIICTYSRELFKDTLKCIESLMKQDHTDKEIILVMDANNELYRMYVSSLPASVKIISNPHPGLSEARNLGIRNADGDIIAFIDDDASVDKNYILTLLKNYEDPNIAGVTGKIIPEEKPKYPEELYWVGGFTYKGFPDKRCEVRNGHGCNISFRKKIFEKVGMFDVKLGRVGRKLVTAEETEFCIRISDSIPGAKIIFDPSAIVYHKVHGYRQGIGYIVRRGFFEGMSKAHIEHMYSGKEGKSNTLAIEGSYLKFLFSKAIPERMKNIITGKDSMKNMKESMLILAVIGSVGTGYMAGKLK